MAFRFGGQRTHQFVALLLGGAFGIDPTRPSGEMRLIDNHQLGRVGNQHRFVAVGFDEVDASDHARVMLIDGDIGSRHFTLQAGEVGRLNHSRSQAELFTEFLGPLVA